MFWDIEHAREVMSWYREFLPQAPEELCAFLGLKTVPSSDPFPAEIRGRKICALVACYDGGVADGQEVLRPAREELPPTILDWVSEMPFPAMQSLFDPLMPKGMQWYWKGDFVEELSDAAIDVHLEHIARAPSELSLVHLYPIDGAVHRVAPDATAWRCRNATWNMVIAAIDPDAAKAGELKRWGRAYWEAIHTFHPGGAYVNFMMDDEDDGRVATTYGANYTRLREIKKAYDPDNLFRVNQNILPTA